MKIKRAKELIYSLPENRTLEDYPYSLSDKVFHTNQLFLYSEKALPGRKASAPHFHRSIDEIIYVLNGELVAVEGEESCVLRRGDSICFLANSQKMHYLENRSDNEAEFLIFRRSTTLNDVVYSSHKDMQKFPSKV